MINKNDYLQNPCRASSIPYWKASKVSVPDNVTILHQEDFDKMEYARFFDEPYFRLRHNLQGLSQPALPQGYSLCNAALREFAAHINRCYDEMGITEDELQKYVVRSVYNSSLWLAVKDNLSGDIVATGIAEMDREIGEGVLEWVQVSKAHRGCGLGGYIVMELLCRMKDAARFATVSGRCKNPTNPEGLYRKCGFAGSDVWHILRRRV